MAAPPIRAFDDLQIGERGLGRTVFAGQEIGTFDFEIVELLSTGGYAANLILIRCFGAEIDRLGGIAYGMSGSPLYLGDELIGAVSMTTEGTDSSYGYATPIEDMLALWDLPTGPPAPAAARGLLDALPVGTPVRLGGLGARARAPLAAWLAGRGLRPLQGPEALAQPIDPADLPPAPDELQPGSAVSVALASGDVAVEATGTVTWRDAERLLAFGHPFLRAGATELFLTPAYVATVLPSRDMPMKVAFPVGDPLGSFVADRAAGLAGRVGATPAACRVSLTVRDADLGRERTLTFDAVRDAKLVPTLVGAALIQGLDEVMDREGEGGAELSWTLEADGLAQPLRRDDLFYDEVDVVGEVVTGPLYGLERVLSNDFVALSPRRLDLRVEVRAERRTTRLVAARLVPATAGPGEVVSIDCTLQPYRGQAYEQRLDLQLPADLAPGRLIVEIHGREAAGAESPPASLAELLAEVAEGQRGDALRAELLTPELAAARRLVASRAAVLPSTDPLEGEPVDLTRPELAAGDLAALASVEARLGSVVQGRLSRLLTVQAP